MHLIIFGLGYTGIAIGHAAVAAGLHVTAATRDPAAAGSPSGIEVVAFTAARQPLMRATHLLATAPPDRNGDPVLAAYAEVIASAPALRWIGYLSTTGVYGDRGGGWVDETSALRPSGARGRRRVAAERGWLDLWRRRGVAVHIFRLAGIYGPGRSPFEALRAGTAKRIDRPGQVFSRIHVEDLANVLAASIAQPRPGSIYNICDDEPAEPAAVIAHAARLLGIDPPPLVPFDQAGLSPMARSFWADKKRVSNALIKTELGVMLRYPNYRTGLKAILAEPPT
jgi:nucleoside-diphosphate-sugar epimerase